MIDSKELREMIVEFFSQKIHKNICARSQRYEEAAIAREFERNLSKQICSILTNSEVSFESAGDWNKFESIIEDYCKKAYNTVDPEQVVKVITVQMKRIDRLNELGI
jgi:hypothetical protein